jgi:hypothetical protein
MVFLVKTEENSEISDGIYKLILTVILSMI